MPVGPGINIDREPNFGIVVEPKDDGAKVMMEARLFKAKLDDRSVVAELSPNLNTGASISSSGVSGSLLGIGCSIGKETSISTPLGKIGWKF